MLSCVIYKAWYIYILYLILWFADLAAYICADKLFIFQCHKTVLRKNVNEYVYLKAYSFRFFKFRKIQYIFFKLWEIVSYHYNCVWGLPFASEQGVILIEFFRQGNNKNGKTPDFLKVTQHSAFKPFAFLCSCP